MIAGLIMVAALAVQPPRTVNGATFGTAEQFRRFGPLSVCLESTRIRVGKGETSELDYLGIHAGRVRLKTPNGDLLISEGDAWATPKRGVKAFETDSGYVERIGKGKKSRYLIFAHTDYDDKPVARVWVEGNALHGDERDVGILDRIEVTKSAPKDCDQSFDYGWDMLLGD